MGVAVGSDLTGNIARTEMARHVGERHLFEFALLVPSEVDGDEAGGRFETEA